MSVANNNTIWSYLKNLSDKPITEKFEAPPLVVCQESGTERVYTALNERGGFSQLVNFCMLPNNYRGPDLDAARRTIRATKASLPTEFIEKLEEVAIEGNGLHISGVIIYPVEASLEKCVVYYTPNEVNISELLTNGLDQNSTPYHILRHSKCPMILFDYQRTGLNQKEGDDGFVVTSNEITLEGGAVLNYAMEKFRQVDVWGSSLGGAVATVACDNYLKEHPSHTSRLSLFNHDSFTNSIDVVSEDKGMIEFASLFGGNLDALPAMQSLVQRGLKITVLSHKRDPVIQPGARIIDKMGRHSNVTLIRSELHGHANLTKDMLDKLYA